MIGTVNTSDGGLYTLAAPEWCCTYMKRVNKTKFKWEKKELVCVKQPPKNTIFCETLYTVKRYVHNSIILIC